MSLSLHGQVDTSLLGKYGHKVSVQVKVANIFLRIGNQAGIHVFGIYVTCELVVAFFRLPPRHFKIDIANARHEMNLGIKVIV